MHSNHDGMGREDVAVETPARSAVGAVGLESISALTDNDLMAATRRLVCVSNRVLAVLLAHLAEVEARGLHRKRACSSLYTYCIYELRMPEDTAYRRVAAARLVKRFPQLLPAIERGELHLTGALLLGPHLTETNIAGVLERAKFRTKKEITKLVRLLSPLPDVPGGIEPLGLARPAHPFSRPTWSTFVASLCPVRELQPDERPSNWLPSEVDALGFSTRGASLELEPDAIAMRISHDPSAVRPVPSQTDTLMAPSPMYGAAPPMASAHPFTSSDDASKQCLASSIPPEAAPAPPMPPAAAIEPAPILSPPVPAPARAISHPTSFEPAPAPSPSLPEPAYFTPGAASPVPASARAISHGTTPVPAPARAISHPTSFEPAPARPDGCEQSLSGPQRYKVQFTASEEYVALVEEAKALLAHALPCAELAEIHLRALRAFVAALKKRKFARLTPFSGAKTACGSASSASRCNDTCAPHAAPMANSCPKRSPELPRNDTEWPRNGARREREPPSDTVGAPPEAVEAVRPTPNAEQPSSHVAPGPDERTASPRQRGRHVPAAARRAVFERDGNRCAYIDARGERCRETARLELHHHEPFARGGPSTPENLSLYCAAHNALAAEQDFGRAATATRREHPHLTERTVTRAEHRHADEPT